MTILATKVATLDALNEEVILAQDVYMQEADGIGIQAYTDASSTWTITFYGSLDGTNYVAVPVTPFTGSFGNNFSAAGTTYSNIFTLTTNNMPYVKVKMTAYTSGNVTLTCLTRKVFK
jgi:GH24 family phage-related lysozyme (muramidase)